MPSKRPRRTEANGPGLAAGERLKRTKLAGSEHLAWSWVGTEVIDPSYITEEHRLITCGFSDLNPYTFCANRYIAESRDVGVRKVNETPSKPVEGELEDDIIVVSDEERASPACSSKLCRANPNCLNYLGQEKWENEGGHST